jgi:hypothetical protein
MEKRLQNLQPPVRPKQRHGCCRAGGTLLKLPPGSVLRPGKKIDVKVLPLFY